MPELPEVETVRRRLEPLLVGRRFDRVEILDPRLTRPEDPLEVAAELVGERVEAVDRRGKYLVIRFESGRVLLVHLRMTGSLLHVDGFPRTILTGARASSSTTARGWSTATCAASAPGCSPSRVRPSRISGPASAASRSRRRSPRSAWARRWPGRRAPVKAAILDQRRLAGVGNIYADEALWRARIHPQRPAGELDEDELRALHRGIRAALKAGIARQGATLRDYRTPDGGSGRMQHEFKVYGREGEPCERCGRPIEKTRAAGRGTWFCPDCQPLPHIAHN